jgi:hypothetical protein
LSSAEFLEEASADDNVDDDVDTDESDVTPNSARSLLHQGDAILLEFGVTSDSSVSTSSSTLSSAEFLEEASSDSWRKLAL